MSLRLRSARELASRSRWSPMTPEQRQHATQAARQGRSAAAAKRREREATVGKDGRTSGNLVGAPAEGEA
jgi:hypothetical protein